jgi:hypothetical protein
MGKCLLTFGLESPAPVARKIERARLWINITFRLAEMQSRPLPRNA